MPAIDNLSAEAVEQRKLFFAQVVQELRPSADTRLGPLLDLVILPMATLDAYRRAEMEVERVGLSLKLLQDNPEAATTEVADRVLANYMLTRKQGGYAYGDVLIIVDEPVTTSVPAGALFSANGLQFQATEAFIAIPTGSAAVNSAEQVLAARGDGSYSFLIRVTCVDAGVAGQLKKDTLLTPAFGIVGFLKAFTAQDFVGGLDVESNSEAIARLAYGISAKAASSRAAMMAAILDEPEFSDIISSSIIGYGDAEQRRDRHSILPFALGSRTDWYIRSQLLPAYAGSTREATLVQKLESGFGVWQMTFGRDDYPGMYDVTQITGVDLQETSTSYEIVEDIRGKDMTAIPGELLPDVTTVPEAAFTRFQTATLRFADTRTPVALLDVGAKKDYAVTVRYMPLMAELQSYAASRHFRHHGGDLLVKAPVPCFVSLSLQLFGRAGVALPNADSIKNALATYVNQLGFAGRIHASALTDIVRNYLSAQTHVSSIDMAGTILYPDGTTKILRAVDQLVIPEYPDLMVTQRTVAFILDPRDIHITGATVAVPTL